MRAERKKRETEVRRIGTFKKFTDFFAGFALFAALMFLFREFMSFTPKEETAALKEKLLIFFSKEPIRDYFLYLPLVQLLLLSLVLSLLFKKMPYVGFGASLLPLGYAFFLFTQGKIYERPMLYLILTLLHAAGNLYACVEIDRTDRKRRAALAADLACFGMTAFCGMVIGKAFSVGEMDFGDLSFFEQLMQDAVQEGASIRIFVVMAIVYAVLVLLRLLWRDLYFLDAALSLLPTAYLLHAYYTNQIPFHGELLLLGTVLCVAARLTVMLFCKPRLPITAEPSAPSDSKE